MQISNLLHKLTKPNGMTLTQSYEAQRDLLTGMAYHRGSTLVAQREYTYDVLSRPTARTTSRQGNVVNDTFVHNSRSELASAQVNGEAYGYDYDNVGNRRICMPIQVLIMSTQNFKIVQNDTTLLHRECTDLKKGYTNSQMSLWQESLD